MYQVEFDKTKRLFGEYEKAIGIAVEFDKNTNLIEAINFYNKSLEISDKLLALPHNHYSKAIEAKNQSVQKRIIELMNLQQQQDPNQNQQENAQNPPISLNTQQNNVIQYVDQPKAGLNNEFQHRIYLNLQKINLQNQQMPYRNPPKTTIPNTNQQQLVDECQNNETPNQQIIIETPPKTDIHCNYQHQVPYNTSANRVSSQAQQNKQKPIHNETPPMTEIPMQNQQKPMYNQSKNENQIQYRQKSYSRYQQNPIEIPPKAEIPKQNQPKPAKTTPKPENTNQNQQDITANLPNQDTPLQSQQKPQKNQLKNENPTQNQQRPFKKTIKPENQIKSESSSTNSVLKKNKLRPDLIRRNKATQDQITNENSQTKIPNKQDQINSETTQNNKTKSRIKNSNSYLEKTENNSSQKSKFQKIVESDPSSFIKPPGTNCESQTSIKEASTEINESYNDQIIPQISTINNQGRRRSKSTRAQRKNNQLGFTRPKHYQSKKLYVPPLLSNRIEQYESFTFDFLLGKGSFGSVYLVTRKDDGAKYALKKIESPILSDLNEKQLVREIELMNLANHPLVCHLRGFSFICELNKGRPPFIVTDYYPNGSLNQVVSGFKKFTPTQKLIALYGIANAMSYLHSIGIVHRDLKPENVLLDKADHPIVCDFGLSKLMEDSKARQTGAAGSPVYMAPELIWRQDYTNSIDVYAYAYVCYELLTETLAFSDVQSIPELVDLVCNKHKRPPLDGFDDGVLPMAFRKFISLCWNDDPTKRPSFKEIVSLFVKGKLRISGVDENIFNDFVNSIPRY